MSSNDNNGLTEIGVDQISFISTGTGWKTYHDGQGSLLGGDLICIQRVMRLYGVKRDTQLMWLLRKKGS